MRQRKLKRKMAAIAVILTLLAVMFLIDGCGRKDTGSETGKGELADTSENYDESYGVFLGIDEYSFNIKDFDGYDFVVIDAQELRKEQLKQLHSSGHIVYSYLNVGSLEKSREYFGQYKKLRLDRYENWPDEFWVNVSDAAWITFAGEILPGMILKKDPQIDGFFLDNLDIYAHMQEKKKYESIAADAYDSLIKILESYRDMGLPVLVNGADDFVTRLIEEGEQDLIRGVNQETVFTRIIDYDRDKFGVANEDQVRFYARYLKKCSNAGLDVFLLEYTQDEDLAEKIAQYCEKNGYRYYISEHVNLNPNE